MTVKKFVVFSMNVNEIRTHLCCHCHVTCQCQLCHCTANPLLWPHGILSDTHVSISQEILVIFVGFNYEFGHTIFRLLGKYAYLDVASDFLYE